MSHNFCKTLQKASKTQTSRFLHKKYSGKQAIRKAISSFSPKVYISIFTARTYSCVLLKQMFLTLLNKNSCGRFHEFTFKDGGNSIFPSGSSKTCYIKHTCTRLEECIFANLLNLPHPPTHPPTNTHYFCYRLPFIYKLQLQCTNLRLEQ